MSYVELTRQDWIWWKQSTSTNTETHEKSKLHLGHYELSVQFYQYYTVVVETLHQYLWWRPMYLWIVARVHLPHIHFFFTNKCNKTMPCMHCMYNEQLLVAVFKFTWHIRKKYKLIFNLNNCLVIINFSNTNKKLSTC
jgi:hypothetical protein